MKPILFHCLAREELDEAVAFYEQKKSGLGIDLLTTVERAMGITQQNPQIGASYKTTGFRHFVVQGFPYIIFYRVLTDAIWIVAVAHGKRRPD